MTFRDYRKLLWATKSSACPQLFRTLARGLRASIIWPMLEVLE